MRKLGIALITLTAVVASVVVAPVPASAGFTHSISVSPTTARPTESVTVSGTSDCASVPYTVTLVYTNPAGDAATATASGTTDAAGEYTQAITIPEDAVAGEPASISSTILCSGGDATSNTVNVTIAAWEGTISVSPTSGPVGTEVSITGANCYGDDIVVAFGDGEEFPYEVEDVTLNEDRTFSATFTIPNEAGPGQYEFVAECPGSDFEGAAFTVTPSTGGQPTPPDDDDDEDDDDGTGPAQPVRRQPDFTG